MIDAVEPLVRADEMERLKRLSTLAKVTRHPDESLTVEFEAVPGGSWWVPVSREVITQWAAGVTADTRRVRAGLLADLRARVRSLARPLSSSDAGEPMVWLDDVLALLDEAAS